jgi:hypothetical protein
MGDENEKAFPITSLLTAVPVAGIILAAQYDLGYFGFVDMSLFTLFSWSDHIVFALHALLAASLLAAILGWSLYKFSFDIPMNQQPRRRLWFIAIVFGLFAIVSALNSTFDMMLYWIVMALIAVCAMYLRVGLAGILLSYSMGLLVGAYGLGYYDARTALNSRVGQTLFTATGQMNGQVFRSGERGMLFFDAATKKVNFLRWDEVKRLEATVNGPL